MASAYRSAPKVDPAIPLTNPHPSRRRYRRRFLYVFLSALYGLGGEGFFYIISIIGG
jgi:hypothetical protein